MKTASKQKGGITKTVLIVAVLLSLLLYFGDDIKKFVSKPEVKEKFSFTKSASDSIPGFLASSSDKIGTYIKRTGIQNHLASTTGKIWEKLKDRTGIGEIGGGASLLIKNIEPSALKEKITKVQDALKPNNISEIVSRKVETLICPAGPADPQRP